MTHRFLEGVKVLEFTHMVAGPLAARRLSDFGAQVIKIESQAGDKARNGYGRPEDVIDGDHLRFHLLNGGKRCIQLDMKREDDREVILRLAREADVVIQNFRPGALDRYGLGYEQLRANNPALVYGSLTGFGPGRWKDDPGQDVLAQARSGIMWLNGAADSPPVAIGSVAIDITAGNLLAQGILAALFRARATGEGAHVETSLLEAGLELQADGFPMFLNRGGEPPRRSRSGVGAHPDMPAPYGVYPTADGYVAIVGAPPAILAEVLGEEYLTPDPALSRDANRDRVLERMAEVVKERPTAHWMERLKSDAGMVMEVLDWRQLSESGGFADLEIVATEPNDRGVRVMRTPIRFDGERPPVPSAAPRLNGDEDDVRRFGWR